MSTQNLFIGSNLFINCTTDIFVAGIELLDSSGNVLISGNGTHISLEITEITEAHNDKVYMCRTFGPFGNQTDTVPLKVKIASGGATIAGATTSMLLILLIATSGIIVTIVFIRK